MKSTLHLWLGNLLALTGKELRSLLGDLPLMALIAFSFSAAIYITATGIKTDVDHASVAVVDADRSQLSARLSGAIQLPYFRPPVALERQRVGAAMERGDYIFVLEIPPRFEADLAAGRQPAIQLAVDATALTQAGIGTVDLQQIILREVADYFQAAGVEAQLPLVAAPRVLFNPNSQSHWFTGVMQIITNITALGVILDGAAVIREREHGTIEHLLVMPVQPNQIALAKIIANSAVILLAVMLSLWLVVHLLLAVPLPAPLWRTVLLFALGSALYLFAVAALGLLLATATRSMPQFGLLSSPVYVVLYLLSGAATPVESMPQSMQQLVRISPATQYVTLAQAVLYRGAGLDIIWPQLLAIALAGALFLWLALRRFRSMLSAQA